jgi:FAD/FMN-containing dehydrogenase
MGGQQFGTDTWLIDLRRHAAFHSLDDERGLLIADAGIVWPDLIAAVPPGIAQVARLGAFARSKPAPTA